MLEKRTREGQILLTYGNCIIWKSQLQSMVALAANKVEYIVATKVANEAIWLKGLLIELKVLDQWYFIQIVKVQLIYAKTLCFSSEQM